MDISFMHWMEGVGYYTMCGKESLLLCIHCQLDLDAIILSQRCIHGNCYHHPFSKLSITIIVSQPPILIRMHIIRHHASSVTSRPSIHLCTPRIQAPQTGASLIKQYVVPLSLL